jgi:hypothetical protein
MVTYYLTGLHKLSFTQIHNSHPNEELHRQMLPKRIGTVIHTPETFRLEVPWTIRLRIFGSNYQHEHPKGPGLSQGPAKVLDILFSTWQNMVPFEFFLHVLNVHTFTEVHFFNTAPLAACQ